MADPTPRRRQGDWMQTYTGRLFWPLDPDPDEVEPLDIAHALGMICRYGGHADRFYCPTPEQRVLTADLRWVPSGELVVGDELLGFDEDAHELGQAGKARRRFRHSTVLTAQPVKRRVIRLVMEDGRDVSASAEHPWLVATKVSRNQSWQTAEQIADAVRAGHARYMHRFVEPWTTDGSRDGGWLAGILDGEGHVSLTRAKGIQFGVAQRPGLVLKEIEANMARLGFGYAVRPVGTSDVQSLQIAGGWRELARLLGTTRPVRLLDKFTSALRDGSLDKQMNGVGAPARIVAAYDEGEQWVAGLETSSRTYLCEGYGAHNSVAEHCVLLSYLVPPKHALWALLHDAAEAYVGDMVAPLKRHLPEYKQAELRVMQAIRDRFGLVDECPREVKEADLRIMADEARQVMARPTHPWGSLAGVQPFGVTLHYWSPQIAKTKWFTRFEELTSA